MNIEKNTFTVLEKDLKNVSERKLPFSNLKISKVYKLIAFLKTLQKLKGMAESSSLGTRQTDGNIYLPFFLLIILWL
jgi:hypothetical protein